MAKRSHPKRKKPAAAPAPAPTPAAAPSPDPEPKPDPKPKPKPTPKPLPTATARGIPRNFFWLEIPWAKLVVFRFAFFALLSIDAFLQLPHASRYGANNFNVPHFGWLPLPEPGRASITFAHGAMCILFALVAQGALTHVALPLATVLYGWAYFSSQLDSYQHHYLVWLLLVILCFAPRAPDPLLKSASPDAARTTSSWAIRLALVQVSIVYLWAAIAKMDTLWVDGSALFIQVRDGWFRNLVESIGFSRMAVFIIAGELFLAAALWNRTLWLFALPVGIGLHLGIELVGLEIGLFSYLMFAVYLLVVPDVVYARAAAWITPHLRGRSLPAPLRLAAWPAAIAAVVATAVLVPLPLGAAIIITYALMAVAAAIAHFSGDRARSPRVGWALALAALVPLLVHVKTDTASDYYRYWAGSARRLGDEQSARGAYLGLLEVDPSSEYAHYYLGLQEGAAHRLDAALAHFEAAQRAAPERGRAFFAAANVHLQKSDPAAAKAELAAGLAVDPDPQAQSLYRTLGGEPVRPERAPEGRVEGRTSPHADQD